jgi:hypothetical protein
VACRGGLGVSDFGALTFIGIFLGIALLHFVAVVAAGLWEKRPVQPYYVPATGEEYAPTLKAAQANEAAKALGFRHGGLCHDGKGKIYRVRYDFWIAPDDSILAIVGGGTVASIAVDAIELYSRLADGRTLSTTNYTGQADISGVLKQLTCPNGDMHSLVARHQRRLSDQQATPFPADAPIAGYFEIRRQIAETLVEKGLASYLDSDQKVWKYTLKGAIAFYFLSIWIRPLGRSFRSCE